MGRKLSEVRLALGRADLQRMSGDAEAKKYREAGLTPTEECRDMFGSDALPAIEGASTQQVVEAEAIRDKLILPLIHMYRYVAQTNYDPTRLQIARDAKVRELVIQALKNKEASFWIAHADGEIKELVRDQQRRDRKAPQPQKPDKGGQP